jgi:catechol 2,3-dioxygenase-like lactoylglutathione lyase family enzyme
MSLYFTPGETNIICTNLDRSLQFYGDVLGFTVIEHESPAAVHMRCADRPFLLLAVAKSPLAATAYCEVPTISFDLQVDDIKETVGYLRDLSVPFESSWQEGDTYVFIKDPDGLVIEIVERED